MNHDLYIFHTLVPSNTSSASGSRQLRVSSSLPSQDHNLNSSQFCHSWNAGHCRWPFGRCRFRHACEVCTEGKPSLTSLHRGERRSRSPTPKRKKNASGGDPQLSSSFDSAHSSSGFGSQAVVSRSSLLRSSSSSSCGHP